MRFCTAEERPDKSRLRMYLVVEFEMCGGVVLVVKDHDFVTVRAQFAYSFDFSVSVGHTCHLVFQVF